MLPFPSILYLLTFDTVNINIRFFHVFHDYLASELKHFKHSTITTFHFIVISVLLMKIYYISLKIACFCYLILFYVIETCLLQIYIYIYVYYIVVVFKDNKHIP